MPPLRERKNDIPLLITHFIKIFSEKTGKLITGVSEQVMQKLVNYSWQGNVRELQNLLERSIVLADGKVIKDITLPTQNQRFEPENVIPNSIKTIEEMQKEHIIAILKQCNNRVAGSGGAAELLNIPASTLASKIKKLGIK